jgi:hypothetical protein
MNDGDDGRDEKGYDNEMRIGDKLLATLERPAEVAKARVSSEAGQRAGEKAELTC